MSYPWIRIELEGMPGWHAVKRPFMTTGGCEYDIFKDENGGQLFVGVIKYSGFLYSSCIEHPQHFGDNVLNATRFLFLKTQKPVT